MDRDTARHALEALLQDKDARATLPAHVREMLARLRTLLDQHAPEDAISQICHGITHWVLDAGFKEVPAHAQAHAIASALGASKG